LNNFLQKKQWRPPSKKKEREKNLSPRNMKACHSVGTALLKSVAEIGAQSAMKSGRKTLHELQAPRIGVGVHIADGTSKYDKFPMIARPTMVIVLKYRQFKHALHTHNIVLKGQLNQHGSIHCLWLLIIVKSCPCPLGAPPFFSVHVSTAATFFWYENIQRYK
jgi:hypothetical protein